MHEFICRTFFYVLAFMFLNTAFGSWPEFDTAAPYFVHYGPRFAIVIALLEATYQVVRRSKLQKVVDKA